MIIKKLLNALQEQKTSAENRLREGTFHDFTGAKCLVERAKAFGEAIQLVKDNDNLDEADD